MEGAVEISSFDQNTGMAEVQVTAPKLYMAIHHMEAEYKEKGHLKKSTAELTLLEGSDNKYVGTLDLSGWKTTEREITINIYLKDGSIFENASSASIGDLIQAMDSGGSQ